MRDILLALDSEARSLLETDPKSLRPRWNSPPGHGLSSSEPFHPMACSNVVAEALIYFSCEKGVGVRIWLLMLATMGPSRSLSSRTLCQAGSF